MVLGERLVADDLEQLHHAAIFVRQYVAVLDILTRKINEAAAHLEVAWNNVFAVNDGLGSEFEFVGIGPVQSSSAPSTGLGWCFSSGSLFRQKTTSLGAICSV
jgi:hypothetical protein